MDAQILPVHNLHMGKAGKKAGNPRHFLRSWRKFRGYKLEDVAELIGSTHATVSRVERGLLPYNESLLESLAWVYKCTPADLIGRDPGKEMAA